MPVAGSVGVGSCGVGRESTTPGGAGGGAGGTRAGGAGGALSVAVGASGAGVLGALTPSGVAGSEGDGSAARRPGLFGGLAVDVRTAAAVAACPRPVKATSRPA